MLLWSWAKVQVSRMWRRAEEEDGQGMVEYGLVVALVAVVAVVAFVAFGDNLTTMVDNLASWVTSKDPGVPAP